MFFPMASKSTNIYIYRLLSEGDFRSTAVIKMLSGHLDEVVTT
jgi:hypothetical protein